ncbi:hypothetical protein NAI69_09870 [Francisella tularensis subsp. holarctica]|nr:hypothetical protein [Francisella tularensis subsp. holarctica]
MRLKLADANWVIRVLSYRCIIDDVCSFFLL